MPGPLSVEALRNPRARLRPAQPLLARRAGIWQALPSEEQEKRTERWPGALGPSPARACLRDAGQQPRGAAGKGRVRERLSGITREARQWAEARGAAFAAARAWVRVAMCARECLSQEGSLLCSNHQVVSVQSPLSRWPRPLHAVVLGSRGCACSATAGPGGVSTFPHRPREEVGRPGWKDQTRVAVTGSNPTRGSSARSTTALARRNA